jgi:hypothetical protein
MPLVPFGAKVIIHLSNIVKLKPSGVDMLFLGFEVYSNSAHCVVITRNFVVPNIQFNLDNEIV